MRKINLLLLSLFISLAGSAQESLWGGQNITSPEIHPDNTVTFRFHAPKAVQVKVTGDFLPTVKMDTQFGKVDVPGYAELKEGKNGIWEYTTPKPLASELYNYSFIVDGLKVTDPSFFCHGPVMWAGYTDSERKTMQEEQ